MSLSRLISVHDRLWKLHEDAKNLEKRITERKEKIENLYEKSHSAMIKNWQAFAANDGAFLFNVTNQRKWSEWRNAVEKTQFGKDIFLLWRKFLKDFCDLPKETTNLEILTFLANTSLAFESFEAKTLEEMKLAAAPSSVITKMMIRFLADHTQFKKDQEYHKNVSTILNRQWLEDSMNDLFAMRTQSGYYSGSDGSFAIPITIENLLTDPKILVWAYEDLIDFVDRALDEEERKQNTVLAPRPKRFRMPELIEDTSPTPPLPIDDDDDDDAAAAVPVPNNSPISEKWVDKVLTR